MKSWKDELDYETVLCHYLLLALIITSDTLHLPSPPPPSPLPHCTRYGGIALCFVFFLFFNGAVLMDRIRSGYCSTKTNKDVFSVIRKERTNV